MNDPGGKANGGSLIVAEYGKGKLFLYRSCFLRELPRNPALTDFCEIFEHVEK
ncbi:MAG: hypothetical protein IPI62_14575 [Bacteroidetes bacterium]|nr:hypothetical protein [Bacteroidota bacterium]